MAGERRHRILTGAPGIRIHAAEQGEGPLVLFVHGFPEGWHAWHHQLTAVADAGFRGVAIDVRGYGRSSKPTTIDSYRMLDHVDDNLGVVAALGEQSAIIVGHDWGAPIACNSALLRPDVFRAVAMLSVPYSPRGSRPPLEKMYALVDADHEFYMHYFQEPGRVEAEIEPDVRGWLWGMYLLASGNRPAASADFAAIPRGTRMRDGFPIEPSDPADYPEWLPRHEFDAIVEAFEYTGLTGPLNRYRNLDPDWHDLAAYAGQPIEVPALFIGGEFDGPTVWGGRAISRFPETLPRLTGAHILPGCGHWVQQERPDDVNRLLVEFLTGLAS